MKQTLRFGIATAKAYSHASICRWSAMVFVLCWPVFATSDDGLLDRISGYYTAPAKFCSSFDGTKWQPCDPMPTDCFVMKKVDEKHGRFWLYSTQAAGLCLVTGVAERVGSNSLRYTEHNPEEVLNYGKSFSIEVIGGYITFRYAQEPQSGADTPFCGVGGRLDRLRFAIKDREVVHDGVCGDYDVAATGTVTQRSIQANSAHR